VRHAPKTATSVRTIPLPRRTVALLLRRARAAGVDLDAMHLDTRPVFPAPGRWGQSTAWRDRSNSAALLRQEFDAAGFPWLSFHGLRRAAVTALLDHLPVRLVADYAGHSSVRTTLDAYIGRSAVSLDVVKHL
jgi:integrase